MNKKHGGKSEAKRKMSETPDLFVVGIGASAGGLDALQDLLGNLPAGLTKVAIIVAQHLSPTHKSMLVQLLSRGTKWSVKEAVNGAVLRSKVVYITPPDTEISVSNGCVAIKKPENPAGPKPSVNVLFRSLATEKKNKAVGIILSGTGSDGAVGITAIKEAGGITLVQEPSTAKYDGMPQAAIETQLVDAVLPPSEMGKKIVEFISIPPKIHSAGDAYARGDEAVLTKIFGLLSKRTGTDFSHYKPTTIGRRLEKRLELLKIGSLDLYLKYLQQNPEELDELFRMCLISVTNFFRDKEAFDELKLQLEKLIKSKKPTDPIRVWAAGCATGEEAYTIAIIISRLLNDNLKQRSVQVFATDIDEKAIAFARKGIYSAESVEFVPPDLLEAYFIKKDNTYEVIKSIRSSVLFSRHDLTSNPPFLKMDLVSCRNLLIYFGSTLQQQIIPLFHYSLNPNGILFLGKSETIGMFSDLFAVIHEKNKLFLRKRGGNLHPLRFGAKQVQKPASAIPSKLKVGQGLTITTLVKETFFNTFEHPYVVINDNLDVVEVQGDVRLYLALQQGSMDANIVKMANDELKIELRAVITKAVKNKEHQKSSIKRFELFGQEHLVRFVVKPLIYTEESDDLFVVIFEKFAPGELTGAFTKPGSGNAADQSRIEELEQELAANKEHLQNYIEELETANEELQSLNEELQSTNEELQSSTEELETSNEELQSSGEEIQIAYTELKSTHEELERKEALLEIKEANQQALLNNTLQSFILVDAAYKIIAFNKKAGQIVGNTSRTPLVQGGSIIDTIEPAYLETFLADFKKALEGATITGERRVFSLDGSPLWFRFNYTPVITASGPKVVSVSMLDVTEAKIAQTELHKTEQLLTSVFNATNAGICITDATGTFVDVNNEYCKIHGYTREELIGQPFTLMVDPDNQKKVQRLHNQFIKTGVENPGEWQVLRKDGRIIDVYLSAELLEQTDGTRYRVTSVRDVTETKKYKNLLLETQVSAHVGGWELDPKVNDLVLTEEAYHLLEIAPGTTVSFKEVIARFETEDKKRLDASIHNALRNGDSFELELKYFTTPGYNKWLRVTCKPLRDKRKTTRLFGTFQDISKRKSFEIQLLQSETKYRSIIENSVHAFFLTIPDGNIEDANQAAEAMFGYSMEEFRALGRFGILDHNDPRLAKLLEIRSRDGKVRGELTGIRKNGERFPCEVSSVIFDDTNGQKRTSTIIIDISEQKAAERETTLLMYNTEENFVLLDNELRIVTFNEQFKNNYSRYLGGEIEKGKSILDFAPPERREATAATYRRVLAGSAEESEMKVSVKGQHDKYFSIRYKPAFDENGTVIGAFVTIADITNIKTTELQLTASEKRYRALVENGGDAVVVLSAEGKPKYVSPSVNRVLGYTEEEAMELDLFSILDPADIEGVATALNNAIGNPGVPVEGHTARMRRKDGSWCYIEATMTNMLHDPDINGIVDNFRDVTAKVKAAEELKQTTYFLEKAQKVGQIGHWVSDPSVENGLLTWSWQTYKIFGISEEGFNGKTEDFFRLVHPDDISLVAKAAKDAISGNEPYNVKHRIIRPDGSVRWVHQQAEVTHDDQGKPLLMIGVVQDITDHINWETDLKARNRFIETTIDNLPIGIAVIKIDDGTAVLMNKKFSDIYGWPEQELSDVASFFQKVYPDEQIRKETIKRIMQDIESRDPERMSWNGLAITTKKGKKKIVNAKTIPLYEQNVMISTVVDVTKEKMAEEALVQSEQKYKILFESSPLPKWIYDEQTLRFLEVNQAAINQYGYTREEFLNLRIQDIKLAEDLEMIEKHVAGLKEVNNVIHFGPWRHLKKNGEIILVETIGHRIAYSGKPAMMILGRDVTENVKAQQELKASNERFIYASKATSDAIWDWDIQNNTIFWGDGYRTLFGYPLESHFVDEKFWTAKIHSEDFERIWQGMSKARDNRHVNAWSDEYRFQRANGSYAYVKERAVILRSDKGSPVRMIGALQDITEAKLYEMRLVEDRNMLRAIIDNIPDHIFVKDLELRQTVSNKALYTEVFNLKSEEEMLGKTMLDFFAPEVAAMYEKDDRHVIETGEAILNRLEFTVNRQGEKIWLSTTKVPLRNHLNEITGLVGIARNITEKYLQEQELTQFTERLNNILESITDPFFAINKKWEFIYMNSAAEKQMGAGGGELIGKNFKELLPGDKAIPYMEEVFEKQLPLTFEIYHEPFNTWYEQSIYPTSEGISVYFRNVSDRKLAEEHLQRAYEEKSNILESIKDGFYTLNRNWQITYWNREAEVLLGKTRDEVVGVTIWEVFPDITNRKFYPLYHRVMKERNPESFEEHFENTNTWYELNVYPSEEGISVYFKDVTKKQQAEEEIRIAKERYEMVAKVSKDAIYDWDITSDSIAWGEGFQMLFGHEWTDIESSVKNFADYVHPVDDAINSKRLQEVLNARDEAVWISEYRFRKSDGTYADILERGFIIRDNNGRAIRMIGSMQDITQRKQYEIKLKELNQQLAERAGELAASNLELERFAYVASHDLQEPLRMVTSFLQLLERKYDNLLDDKAREYIRYAVDGANRMKTLILDLLEYSRVNASANENEAAQLVDLNEVGREISATFSHNAKNEQASITIKNLPSVRGNKEQLARLFQNLLSNALKYHKPDQMAVVEMGATENQTEWVIWIKDNGIGIDPKFFEKIFIIFQRLHNKSEFSGTGIGLAICKKIAEKHGGKIWLESEVGQGSTFFVSFPKNQETKTPVPLK